jgi:hypothetical protein
MKHLCAIAFMAALLLGGTRPIFAQFISEQAIGSDENSDNYDQRMQMEVKDGISHAALPVDLIIKGLNPRKPVVLQGVTDTTIVIKKYRQYTLSCVKEGYMYFSHKFWPDEMSLHIERILLQPLAVGLKTDIEDITFLGDETRIYEKSETTLQELIQFLTINSSVQLKIIGHGNGPDIELGDPRIMKATLQRAETVKNYLVSKGIDAQRLTVEGAGNLRMRYADPRTDWQAEANRRIEIEVVER